MKIKTKHIITCIKCLFLGLVMALPFIAVLPTAIYYGFNQYAVSGDKLKYRYQTNEVNTIEDLKIGNVYYAKYSNIEYNNTFYDVLLSAVLGYNTISILDLNVGQEVDIITEGYWNEEANPRYTSYLYVNEVEAITNGSIINKNLTKFNDLMYEDLAFESETEISLEFNFIHNVKTQTIFNECNNIVLQTVIDNKNISKATYLGEPIIEETINNQNALEIAFNNVFNTKGFNWVSNSMIATPIYAFVGAFGLTSDLFLSNLIVYWTNILLIYGILNIVLVVFTKLTQLGKKKEED